MWIGGVIVDYLSGLQINYQHTTIVGMWIGGVIVDYLVC